MSNYYSFPYFLLLFCSLFPKLTIFYKIKNTRGTSTLGYLFGVLGSSLELDFDPKKFLTLEKKPYFINKSKKYDADYNSCL